MTKHSIRLLLSDSIVSNVSLCGLSALFKCIDNSMCRQVVVVV